MKEMLFCLSFQQKLEIRQKDILITILLEHLRRTIKSLSFPPFTLGRKSELPQDKSFQDCLASNFSYKCQEYTLYCLHFNNNGRSIPLKVMITVEIKEARIELFTVNWNNDIDRVDNGKIIISAFQELIVYIHVIQEELLYHLLKDILRASIWDVSIKSLTSELKRTLQNRRQIECQSQRILQIEDTKRTRSFKSTANSSRELTD